MKGIHFEVPDALYEEFHRVFPVRGEKTLFFMRVMQRAVALKRERDCFIERIWEENRERSET